MPAGEELARYSLEWLRKASKNLRAAELLVQQEGLYDLAAFHCQQAVEKALKGYLTWREQPFRKTHDLLELIDQCIEIDQFFSSFRFFARDISPYAIVARYPDVDDDPDPEEVNAAVQQPRVLLDFVRDRLPVG